MEHHPLLGFMLKDTRWIATGFQVVRVSLLALGDHFACANSARFVGSQIEVVPPKEELGHAENEGAGTASNIACLADTPAGAILEHITGPIDSR